MHDLATVAASLFRPVMLADPYPSYHTLQELDPVHWHEPFGAWILTRYGDVVAALHDPRLRAERISNMRQAANRPELAPLFDLIGEQMNLTDPPRHTRLRRLAGRVFTPHAVEAMRPRIERLVDELLDRVLPRRRFDVIADFAFPMPATVIANLLGLPAEELPRLRRWSDDFATVFGSDPSAVTAEQYEQAGASARELTAYFQAALDERRAQPRDDLLSAFVRAAAEGEPVSDRELIANANVLLGAGHETTTHLIGNGLLALLRHPEQWRLLQNDAGLIPQAVEEFLRYDGPLQFMYRLAGEDLQIGGKSIKAGQLVYLMFGAANRDPRHFPDPDRFDITRRPTHHLAFGQGPHFCLGAPLARLEAQIAFTAILRRLPDLHLTPTELEYQESYELRGLKALPVEFGA